jgi:hypothetical protein
MVDDPSRMEGYRAHAVHATPEARHHDEYVKAWWVMHNNYVLSSRLAPRVL